jgi:hypothetical protein
MSFFRHFSLLPIACLAVASLVLTGCGSKYHQVTGEIVFPDGSPVKGLAGGTIVFQRTGTTQDPTAANNSASGPIDGNGKFTLGTDKVADGAPTGDYTITISPPQPTGDEQIPKVIDPKYHRAGGHKETFTVKPGPNNFKVTVDPVR